MLNVLELLGICTSERGDVNVWTVTSDYVKGELTYFVENKETGERRGTFDCQPWAEEMADALNREGIK